MIKVEGLDGIDWRDTSNAIAAWMEDLAEVRPAGDLKKLALLSVPAWAVAEDPRMALRTFWELRAMAGDAMEYRLQPIHLCLLHQLALVWVDEFIAEGPAWDFESDVRAIKAIAKHLDDAEFHRIGELAAAALAASEEVTVDFTDYRPFFPEATWLRLVALPQPQHKDPAE